MRPRRRRRVRRVSLLGVLVAFGLAGIAVLGLTAANLVPLTHADDLSHANLVSEFAPPQCSALTLTSIVAGSGNFRGTGQSELILGSAGSDTIRGQGGNDCMLGGDGDDTIRGGNGADVCIGGGGNDTFINCAVQYQ